LKEDFYAVDGLSVSPDGKWLAVHQSGGVSRNREKGVMVHPRQSRVIDVAAGEVKHRWPLNDEWAGCPEFSADGKTLTRFVRAGFDGKGKQKTEPRIETIDFATGK